MPRLSKIGAAALAAFGWTSGSGVTITYLVIAGGGSGGYTASNNNYNGGGGAGGFRTSTLSVALNTAFTITVGAGGASGSGGSDSVFSSITSTGGGKGGGFISPFTNGMNGFSGGSGGGGSGGGTGSTVGVGGAGNTPSTSPSQGNTGGSGFNTTQPSGGGGGGAGSVGADGYLQSGTVGNGGNGGSGTASSISGSSVTYAGGGGGGTGIGGVGGSGGSGGGGAGGTQTISGTNATANTGSGGGGAGGSGGGPTSGGSGGSGIVIISYAAPQKFGGGVVTTNGSNIVHTFTTSGTLTPLASLTASYLIVAGGGGATGGFGAGGGAGGLLSGSSLTIDTNSIYNIVVGSGGAGSGGGTTGTATNGSVSSFSIVSTTAVGGGGGGENQAGATGGSAGGNANTNASATSGTSGQGNAGGTSNTTIIAGGGGGGAGAVGANTSGTLLSQVAGNGGVGLTSSILPYSNAQSISVGQVVSTSVYYSGGGGGGNYVSGGNTGSPGTGGSGGGGSGSNSGIGTSGTSNTGGGGGGGAYVVGPGHYTGGNGGSGVVIISYSGSTQLMAGGQVIISGGNVIHVFTSSGSLTPLKSINNSLRFRSGNSAYLSRTPSSATNQTTWTWSGWVKRGNLTSAYDTFFAAGSNNFVVRFNNSTDYLEVYNYVGSYQLQFITAQVFRDPSAWYHIVIAIDTTQAISTNRAKVYVNGSLITAPYGTPTYPSQNTNLIVNSATGHYIGQNNSVGAYFDGYMAEINFIDGQALTPSSFGSTNSYGVWQPTYYGGSYGTNGFYLPFSNTTSTTTLGYDYSSNGNNWTTYNISLTAGSTYDAMTDSPTLSATASNYCVLSPINYRYYSPAPAPTLSNGNLTVTQTSSAYSSTGTATMGVSSGKWYWEATFVSGSGSYNLLIGVVNGPLQNTTANDLGYYSNEYAYNSNSGNKSNNHVTTAYGASFTSGDVIGVALDLTAGTITFYKNNTSQGIAYSSMPLGDYYFPAYDLYNSNVLAFNFGQQPFTYTPPTGYVALNAYNLSTPTIPNGRQYMDATIWTSVGGTETIYNSGAFQPDFVWLKNRTITQNNYLLDSNRGASKYLVSNLTGAEVTNSTFLTSFNSNGFSLGTGGFTASQAIVGWQWQAGKGSNVSNTNGSITSTVSANTTSGFSIVTYTNASSGTVGHGLGVAPAMVIYKDRTNATNWIVIHQSLTNMSTYYLTLNTTNAVTSGIALGGNPTSSVIYTNTNIIQNGAASVAYCFAQVAGFSAFGSWTGNGSASGPFIYCGFQPRFILSKRTDTAGNNWMIIDTARNPYNVTGSELYPSSDNSELTGYSDFNVTSNGFQIAATYSYINASGGTYIYMAFASNPFKYSNAF